ncbi:MAG TPA: hypothetical protein VG389_20515 [Myxococcota bacterium]|nr:hypothetical protein [Myxococcota bacterium]
MRQRAGVGAGLAAVCAAAAVAAAGGGCRCRGAIEDGGPPATDAGPEPIAAPLACQEALAADAPYGDGTCPVDRPAAPDLLDDALAVSGIDRCTLRWEPGDVAIFGPAVAADPWRLPFYDATHDAAANAPVWARRTIDRFDGLVAGATPLASAVAGAADRLGFGAAGTLCTAAYGIDPGAPLAQAIVDLFARVGVTTNPGDRDGYDAALVDVPFDLQVALAPVVAAVGDAAAARTAVLGTKLTTDLQWQTAFRLAASLVIPTSTFARLNPADPFYAALLHDTDFAALYAAAVTLALTVEAADLGAFAGAAGFSFTTTTPIGRIVLRDAADDVYDTADPDLADGIALLVDTGGADDYRIAVAANTSYVNPVSVAVDLDGADTYAYVEVPDPNDGPGRLPSDEFGRYDPPGTPDVYGGPISLSDTNRQGAGRLGFAFLFDLGGDDDTYRSPRMAQGFGTLGVGGLYDDGGNDTYLAEDGAQGAGIFGIGVLVDAGTGADRYESYASSQGFAYTYGFGLLHDGGGDDVYECDIGDPTVGGDPLYLSAQLPGTGNSSFCQGAGFGRRSDTAFGGDGIYMSGGIGMLRDRGTGHDTYTSSVFGTGTGYWFGTGLLSDEGGDDWYDGKWYVQGSTAHFAMTIFWDEAGDDLYNMGGTVCTGAPMCMLYPSATSVGVGHDFSVTWHVDGGGNDFYFAPGLSLGAGNVNGIGVLVNAGGDDTYITAGQPTLGAANLSDGNMPGSPRRDIITAGVFIDGGGADSYNVAGTDVVYDDMTWESNIQTATDPTITTEHGVGLDGTGTVVLVP